MSFFPQSRRHPTSSANDKKKWFCRRKKNRLDNRILTINNFCFNSHFHINDAGADAVADADAVATPTINFVVFSFLRRML
jgi:hypothetical protein